MQSVVIWYLDLQLPVQSVPITTNNVSSNPANDEVYLIQHYVIKFVTCGNLAVFFNAVSDKKTFVHFSCEDAF